MALIIDGSTFPGFWKFTADHLAPNDFQTVPKFAQIDFVSTGVAEGNITYGGTGYLTGATTIDENGNALDTSIKVARYLSDNR
jgi:hypothetical protein